MKSIPKIVCSLILLITIDSSNALYAQDQKTDKQNTQAQEMLTAKKFIFIAQSVTPSRGGFRQLTSSYDLRVSGDSLICNLPYFGRAYTAPMDPASGGLNFTSTSFDYTITPRKKSGWDVSIKPKDYKDVQQLLLSIFSNGSASLMVTSTNRQPIMFNGSVRKL